MSARLRLATYDPAKHLQGCAEALRSGFGHNHWPLWKHASPRLAEDLVRLMAAPCNLNLVVEDESGRAWGQIFCAAPLTQSALFRAGPGLLKLLAVGGTGLYFMRPAAWRHLAALRGFGPLLARHPSDRPHFEVVLFVCHQNLHGKGWGTRLMHEAVRRMAAQGAPRAVLLTDSTMAWRFYERYGYARAVDVPLGPAYTVALQSRTERGYVYALDVKGKAGNLAER